LKRAAIYCRVSTLDQHPETQLMELRALAIQRGYEVVAEFTDHGFSGAQVKRSGLDELLLAARHAKLDVVLVWACDRLARSTRHLLEVLDEFNRLRVEFVSLRENIDTGGPLGRALITIIGAIAELERSLIIERVRAGMRRAKLEGRHVGRKSPLIVDRMTICLYRDRGLSLAEIAHEHGVSRSTVARILKQTPGPAPPPRQADRMDLAS